MHVFNVCTEPHTKCPHVDNKFFILSYSALILSLVITYARGCNLVPLHPNFRRNNSIWQRNSKNRERSSMFHLGEFLTTWLHNVKKKHRRETILKWAPRRKWTLSSNSLGRGRRDGHGTNPTQPAKPCSHCLTATSKELVFTMPLMPIPESQIIIIGGTITPLKQSNHTKRYERGKRVQRASGFISRMYGISMVYGVPSPMKCVLAGSFSTLTFVPLFN
jgi:hypothetical protein